MQVHVLLQLQMVVSHWVLQGGCHLVLGFLYGMLKSYNEVRTYPNPFENQVTFSIESNAASNVTIRVFDLLGKEIHTAFEPVNLGSNEVNVNLNKVSHPGIYLYKIEFENGNGKSSISSGKLIKR